LTQSSDRRGSSVSTNPRDPAESHARHEHGALPSELSRPSGWPPGTDPGATWHSPNLATSRRRLGSPAGLVRKPPDHTRLPVPGGQAGHSTTSRTGGASHPGTWPHSGAGQIIKPAPQSWPPLLFTRITPTNLP